MNDESLVEKLKRTTREKEEEHKNLICQKKKKCKKWATLHIMEL